MFVNDRRTRSDSYCRARHNQVMEHVSGMVYSFFHSSMLEIFLLLVHEMDIRTQFRHQIFVRSSSHPSYYYSCPFAAAAAYFPCQCGVMRLTDFALWQRLR